MIKQESNVSLIRLLDVRQQYEFHKGGFTLLQGKLFANRKLFISSITKASFSYIRMVV